MKLSDVKTLRDLCSSMFVLNFEPEHNKKKKSMLKLQKSEEVSFHINMCRILKKDIYITVIIKILVE